MLKNEKGQMIVEEKDLKRVSMKFYNRIYKALVNTQEIKESKTNLLCSILVAKFINYMEVLLAPITKIEIEIT
jgi:hypothetical protein